MGGDAENDIHEIRVVASPNAGSFPRSKSATAANGATAATDAKAVVVVSAPPTPHGNAGAAAHHSVSFRLDAATAAKDMDTHTDKNGGVADKSSATADDESAAESNTATSDHAATSGEHGGGGGATHVKATRAHQLALTKVRVSGSDGKPNHFATEP